MVNNGFESYELFQAVFEEYLMPDAQAFIYHGSEYKRINTGKNMKEGARTFPSREELQQGELHQKSSR